VETERDRETGGDLSNDSLVLIVVSLVCNLWALSTLLLLLLLLLLILRERDTDSQIWTVLFFEFHDLNIVCM